MNERDTIVLHCTDRNPETGQPFADAAEVRDYHMEVRGWSDIGYHYVIERDGRVVMGRQEATNGAHLSGHNYHTLGVCLMGGEDSEFTFTAPQLTVLMLLLRDLCSRHSIPTINVTGHCEWDDRKACPVLDMAGVRAALDLWRLT